LLEYEEALQQQRAAKEQQADADRHKHEQMGRVMNAAQDNHEHEHSQRSQRSWTGLLTFAMPTRLRVITKHYAQE
jgi:hypothetical protein